MMDITELSWATITSKKSFSGLYMVDSEQIVASWGESGQLEIAAIYL
jgi:hypothetical protein